MGQKLSWKFAKSGWPMHPRSLNQGSKRKFRLMRDVDEFRGMAAAGETGFAGRLSKRWSNLDFRYHWRRASLPFRWLLYPQAVITADHFRLRIDLRDRVIAGSLFKWRTWEPEMVALFRMLSLRGGVCVDVGANLGWHTLVLSECVGPGGKVFAFEPNPHSHQLLLENLRLNNINNVVAARSALGERGENRRLQIHPYNWGDNRIIADRQAGARHEPISVRAGDELLAAVPAGAIKLIKVDTQGYDHFVVRGLHDSLLRNPEAVLAVEVEPAMLHEAGTSAREFVAYLIEQGFSGWELQPHRAFPLLAPEHYEIVDEVGNANLVVSRRPEALARVIGRLFPGPTQPSALCSKR